MSHDLSATIPDEPEQDPDAALDEPSPDDHGLSDSPHSGYEAEMETADARPATDGLVTPGEAPAADLP